MGKKKRRLDPSSYHQQILIQDNHGCNLNINAKTIKLLEENIGEHLCDLEAGKIS